MTPLGLALTKLYTSVSEKFGKEIAEDLAIYVKQEISSEVDIKTTHLATKEDLAHVKSELKEDIANARGEFKEDLSNTETKLIEKIHGVEAQVAHVKSEMIKWMVGIFITLALMILGLYGTMIFFFMQLSR